MLISLPYDKKTFELELTGRTRIRITGGEFPPPLPDAASALRFALENATHSPPLKRLLPAEGRISILISDISRGGGTGILLRHLLEYLRESGVEPARLGIFLAAGMHRGHSVDELESHLGKDVMSRFTVREHDATDASSLEDAGSSSSGAGYRFNRKVMESALLICLGSVSFHYFAGYGGGRKLILPGVAAESTILDNHRLSLKADPGSGLADGCRPAALEGNPVHDDMLAGAVLINDNIFSINFVQDDKGRALFINGGDLIDSHREACEHLKRSFCIPLERRYRAVIMSAGGYPRDINLLQSHKAVRYASAALEPGGTMLVAAACSEGTGSESYWNAFSRGRGGVPDIVREKYTLNSQTAVSTYELTGDFEIYVKTEMNDEDLTRFGFSPWRTGETALLLGGLRDEDILIIKNASCFLPYVN